jgi:hypothetical protein
MAPIESRGEYHSDRMARPSRRLSRMKMSEAPLHEMPVLFEPEPPGVDADRVSEAQAVSRWQVLYTDDELQITFKGHASARQREQIRLAAKLMKEILLP